MMETWNLLLQKLGIARKFTDAAQNQQEYVIDDETLLQMVNHLGFNLKKTDDSEKLLEQLDKKRWYYTFEPIYVVRCQEKKINAVVLKKNLPQVKIFVAQNGKNIPVDYELNICQERKIGNSEYILTEVLIKTELAPEYYDVTLTDGKEKHTCVLAVTPDECYLPPILQKDKVWGFAIQLYALRSKRNWGVGDFSDLADFVKICAQNGADVIGINPLNVLSHDYPENSSPYASISRLFLNPIYIDVEKVSGFKKSMLAGSEKDLQQARSGNYIDYPLVYNLKIKILREIFSTDFDLQDPEFAKFCRNGGDDLELLATYQAIYSEYHQKCWKGWIDWPKELQNPHSAAVKEYAKQHQSEITFFKFLQFEADRQLNSVQKEIQSSGLKIGLYRDLPVGLSRDSAEVWQNNDLFMKDCGAGAPPDVFFPSGQKWCLGAFNPFKLKEAAYKPFIKILRAAMKGSGALRIDHVMSLMRLYIISDKSDKGTYIYYNFDDMLGIVALESYLQKCMVVGESIGNVPDGFIEKLHERGIYSLSVLWAERWNDGLGCFKMPADFPQKAFCSVGTHDMAPLKARWFGYDIETMYKLGMLNEQERINQYKARENERRYLLAALDYAGVWPADNPRQGDCLYGEGYPNGIMQAVEKYMGQSASKVYLAQLEDFFGVEVLQNLPGTDRDKHPNWCSKVPVALEDFSADNNFISGVSAVKNK